MANDFLRSFQALLAEKRDTHRCYIGFKSWQALGMPDGWYVWYGDGLVDATELREQLKVRSSLEGGSEHDGSEG